MKRNEERKKKVLDIILSLINLQQLPESNALKIIHVYMFFFL